MIKNHPFKNGNKRIAVMTLLVFLARNGKWLVVSHDQLYKIAVSVAESDPKIKDSMTAFLVVFLKIGIVKIH